MECNDDLVAVLVGLRLRRDTSRDGFHGHLVHGWFLSLVRKHDRALADALHEAGEAKPFTLSPIFPAQPSASDSDRAVVRITSMAEPLSSWLARLTADTIGPVRIGEAEFEADTVAASPTATLWAGRNSYSELVAKWTDRREVPRHVRLAFLSPTAIKSAGANIPLPLPVAIFGGLARRWNRFAPAALAISETEVPGNAILIRRHDIRTDDLDFGSYGEIGFVGSVDFAFRPGTDPAVARVAHLLADFARFSGVGYKTPMGMGQVAPAWR